MGAGHTKMASPAVTPRSSSACSPNDRNFGTEPTQHRAQAGTCHARQRSSFSLVCIARSSGFTTASALGGRISRRNFVPRAGTRCLGTPGVPTRPPRFFPSFPFPSGGTRCPPDPLAVPVGAAIVVDEGAVGVTLGADGGSAARPALRRRRGFVDPLQAPLLARERHQRSGAGARRGEAEQSIGAPRCRSLRPGAAPGGRGRRRAPGTGAAPGGGRPSRRAPQQPAGRPGAPHAGRGGGSNRCREVGRRNGGGSGVPSTHTDTARLGSRRAAARGMLWHGTARLGGGAATALLPLPVPAAVPALHGTARPLPRAATCRPPRRLPRCEGWLSVCFILDRVASIFVPGAGPGPCCAAGTDLPGGHRCRNAAPPGLGAAATPGKRVTERPRSATPARCRSSAPFPSALRVYAACHEQTLCFSRSIPSSSSLSIWALLHSESFERKAIRAACAIHPCDAS